MADKAQTEAANRARRCRGRGARLDRRRDRDRRLAAQGGGGGRAGRGQQAAGPGPAEAARGPDRGARIRDREPGDGRHEGGAGDGAARPAGGAAGVGDPVGGSAAPGNPRSPRTGAASRWPATPPRWACGTRTAVRPSVCRATRRAPGGGNLAVWASAELLVAGPASDTGQVARVVPAGRHAGSARSTSAAPSLWQVGPGRLFAQTPEVAPIESLSPGGLLRSWRLPDGEPEVLGRVDARKLGSHL